MRIALSRAVMALGCLGFGQHPGHGKRHAPTWGDCSGGRATRAAGTANRRLLQLFRSRPAQPLSSQAAFATDGRLLLDNGLWTDASGGHRLPACGGGSAPPPDWYTLQGVRIISRICPRRNTIRFKRLREAPTRPFPTQRPAAYHVENKVSTHLHRSEPEPSAVCHRPDRSAQHETVWAWGRRGLRRHHRPLLLPRQNNNDHFVEFTFWGLNSWSQRKRSTAIWCPSTTRPTLYTSRRPSRSTWPN